MARRITPGVALSACATAFSLSAGLPSLAYADDPPVTAEQVRQIIEENKKLQDQLRRQQELIDSLTSKVNRIEQGTTPARTSVSALATESMTSTTSGSDLVDSNLGKVRLGAEGGIVFFNSGSEGQFPNSEFRIDEFRLFIDAPVWKQVYFFTELNIATREEPDVSLHLGECYLDFENISELWNQERMLNLRIGRMYIPFGEEYLNRYAIDNPLISHSVSDLWGVDEGFELYGRIGPVRYAMAVQNGGISDVRDFDPDKSIAGRIEYDPAAWLHLSVSGMRTGDLDVQGDGLSAVWFGGGFFRSLGSAATTKFHANLVEGDIAFRLPHGHVSAFGGYINYADNDPAGGNHRDVYYYSIEGVYDLIGKLYGAARFSQVFAHNGFPIAGNGNMGNYFFNPFTATTELWRLSLGLGYRFSPNLVVKAEYSFEHGKEESGETRDHEDLFGVEAAFRF